MALHIVKSYHELIAAAKEAEANDNAEEASNLYEKAIRQQPYDEFAYNRSMILYRKLYQYENELRIIETGIKNFEEYYKKKAQKIIRKNKTAEKLSRSLAKSLGLTDNKGNEIFHTEPIDKWIKRKNIVEKKLGKIPAPKKRNSSKPATKKSTKKK